MEKAVNLEADNWVWKGWNCMKLKVWGHLWVEVKAIGRIKAQL